MWDMSLGCSIAELAANQHFAFFNSFHCQLCEPIKEKRNLSNQKSQTHNSKLLTMCFFLNVNVLKSIPSILHFVQTFMQMTSRRSTSKDKGELFVSF